MVVELLKKLSPPQISNILPAFIKGKDITIPFVLNSSVGAKQFNKVAIIIKTVSTGIVKLELSTSEYYYNEDKRCYIVHFPCFEDAQVGQHYKIQIACQMNDDIGYYSSVGVIKCTSAPQVFIKDRENTKFNNYEYVGVYSQEGEGKDSTEKVYNYKFDLFDSANNLIATSGVLLHNSSNDEAASSVDSWVVRQALKSNLSYYIQYTVYTNNGLECSSPKYEIVEVQLENPIIHADLTAQNNFDEGYIDVILCGKNDNVLVTGNFILLRASSEDGYNTWYELTRFQLSRWDSNTNLLICQDQTVRQGVKYIYAIQAYNSVGTFSNRVENIEGEVLCDYEDMFLYDGERQLKIRFNPKVSNFKNNVLETKTDTLGGKYPFIFRNGNVSYKELAISGMLSLLSESNDDDNLVMEEQGHWLTTNNYMREREYKLTILDWLTNGKPKLFKSPAEGNYIVRLMNVTMTPNDTLGRMLHNFNCTAYEIADYTFENLQALGFATPPYVETRTLQFAQKKYENIVKEESLTLPQACICKIVNEDYEEIKVEAVLADNSEISLTIDSYRTYNFNNEVLKSNPLRELRFLKGKTFVVSWAYYDVAAETVSYIYKIETSDKIVQLLGTPGINFIEQLEKDIRTKTGAFHYIKLSPRDTKKIYERNGNYYLNHDSISKVQFIDNYIYLVVNEQETVTHYIDGRYGAESKKPIEQLSYKVRLGGSTSIDMSLSNTPLTASSFQSLTNITSLDELYLDDGVIADIVYQENIIVYTVEAEESPYRDSDVIQKKAAWLKAKEDNETQEVVDKAYADYINALNKALNALKEEYNVDFAI